MGKLKQISAGIAVLGLFFVSARMLERSRHDQRRERPTLPRFRSVSLPFFSLGHKALLSDLLMARGLSYFGAHIRQKDSSLFIGLSDLFSQAFELDPQNRELILFAANTLAGIDLKSALAILELGMSRHPDYWKFPELAGFIFYYHYRDSARAARYYARAAHLPGHPPYVPSISSKLYEESGYYEQAIGVLKNLASGNRDPKVRQGFEQRIVKLEERLRLRRFKVPVELKGAQNAARLQLDMIRINPYPELEPQLEMDISWILSQANERELAILLSIWRQWTGKEFWMQLRTAEDGQLLHAGETVSGTLLGEGGEDLLTPLMNEIRNSPTLGPETQWKEKIGNVFRICGVLKPIETENGGVELVFATSGLPGMVIDPQNRDAFTSPEWLAWLEANSENLLAVHALLTRNAEEVPVLVLTSPSQIQLCDGAAGSDIGQ